jgi:Dolichyl-phosphate-mannose-protein mannosyltransferase
MRKSFEVLYVPLVILALILRIAIVWIPGNSVRTPWSGGGDMDAYVLLAHNLASGNGYTYAHFPTAFRTPGYPLFLAGILKIFGVHFVAVVRFLQGVAGVAAAYFCKRASRILFDGIAERFTFLSALLFPTLVYFSGEILTEGLTSFFLALFLWALAEDSAQPSWKSAAAMGLTVGLGALVRANLAVLGLLALFSAWSVRYTGQAKRQLLVIPLLAGLIVAPWVLRNWFTFGKPLLSTESGAATVQSLVNPEARLVEGWDQPLRQKMGYVVPADLETNGPARKKIGSEIEMDRQSWQASREFWNEMSWATRLHWIGLKWVTYWLSTDQLLNPGNVSRLNRLLHVGAVFYYWILLTVACFGLSRLGQARPRLAFGILGYVFLITVLHTPFVMNSRIRAPLVDPLISVLAGGGLGLLWVTKHDETINPRPPRRPVKRGSKNAVSSKPDRRRNERSGVSFREVVDVPVRV